MDINKHIIKVNDEEIFHSSGYAQVASGNNLGSTSSVTFNQRLQVEKNRSVIGSYRHSSIGGLYDRPRINNTVRPAERLKRPIILMKRPAPRPSPQPQKRGLFF